MNTKNNTDYKDLLLFDVDNKKKHELIINKTNVIIERTDTGEVVFEGPNKMLLSGSIYTAAQHWKMPIADITPTYNQIMGLENSIHDNAHNPEAYLNENIYLFSIGVDGCGPETHQIYDVNPAKWCAPKDLVPFRVVSPDSDISDNDRSIYHGRKYVLDNTKIAYYFKAFNTSPVWKQQYVKDKTAITKDIYSSTRTDEIECYSEVQLIVTPEDAREWFAYTIGKRHAYINTLSLLRASVMTISGKIYYQNIRPITKVNFSNEPLSQLNRGLRIRYQMYY